MLVPDIEIIGSAAIVVGIGTSIKRKLSIWRGKRHKDPQRLFTQAQRREIFANCDGRCEYPTFLLGRCRAPATEADHIFPWSLGGQTTIENGSGLCKRHNLHKSNHIPSRRYMRRLRANRNKRKVNSDR